MTPERTFAKIADGTEGAARELLETYRAEVVRDSGEYANSLQMSSRTTRGNRVSFHIGSPLARARAAERGANVGDRRGPHHGPYGHLAQMARRWPEVAKRRLRESL
jgi:hypothetical protein